MADFIRVLLVICFLSMAVLAAFYLRKRQLSTLEFAFWGILTILLPVVGPFLVIMMQPGKNKQRTET